MIVPSGLSFFDIMEGKKSRSRLMKSDQMWQAYRILNQTIGDKIGAWAFGMEADYLEELVLMGKRQQQVQLLTCMQWGMNHFPRKMN